MSLRPQDADALQAIVDSTDASVTMSHRLRAIELLAENAEYAPTDGALALARWVDEMTDAEVEAEIMAHFPPDVRERIAARMGVEGREADAALEGRFAELQAREAELRRREERVAELEGVLAGRELRHSEAPGAARRRAGSQEAEGQEQWAEALSAPQVEPPPGVEPGAGFGRRRPLR